MAFQRQQRQVSATSDNNEGVSIKNPLEIGLASLHSVLYAPFRWYFFTQSLVRLVELFGS